MFEVPVVKIDSIKPIEGADLIEVAQVGGYQVVVGKDSFESGEYAIYIPEAAIVPDDIIKELQLEGKLAGSKKNRVKAIKLKGVLSQGLLYRIPFDLRHEPLGADVSKVLGINKYEPPVPISFQGDFFELGYRNTINYDIDHLKKYPNAFGEIDSVTITEKIHGTSLQVGIFHDIRDERLFGCGSNIYIAHKGMGRLGLSFTNEVDNVYSKALKLIEDQLEYINMFVMDNKKTVHLIGEVFGKGIQDLNYDTDLTVRFFDVKVDGKYLSNDEKYKFLRTYGLQHVPVLYQGNYSASVVQEFLDRDSVQGKGKHLMEGVVITADNPDAFHPKVGRPIFKAVSERYLLRKGGTELN